MIICFKNLILMFSWKKFIVLLRNVTKKIRERNKGENNKNKDNTNPKSQGRTCFYE